MSCSARTSKSVAERIPHDHPSVTTVRASLERSGGMNHPKLVLPEDSHLFPDHAAGSAEIVHLVLDGAAYHAPIEYNFDDVPEIRSAWDNPRIARDRDGENRLHDWYTASDLEFGRSVHLDVVEQGHLYGVRTPGEEAIYTDLPKPNESLADIASSLDS